MPMARRMAALLAAAAAHEAEGFRVLAVAERRLERTVTTEADERELTLQGFLLFADSPKPEVRDALALLAALGVAVKIISGDSPVITRRMPSRRPFSAFCRCFRPRSCSTTC